MRKEIGSVVRVEYIDNRVIFNEYPTYPYDQVEEFFIDQERYNHPYPFQSRGLVSDGTTGTTSRYCTY